MEYTQFESTKEKLSFMKKYDLASKTASSVPRLYYKSTRDNYYRKCDLLGYEKEWETWCTMVIDYGCGPIAIHSDYLRDMQNLERKKGQYLTEYVDNFVIFDFETTGINVRSAEIIQIGAIKFENGVEIATFNEFVRPDNPIPKKVTQLTGITDLDVCMARNIEAVLKDFLDFIGGSILVGYNISTFDTTLLYDYAMYLYGIDVSNDYIDLRYIAADYFKKEKIELPDCKLITIANYFNIDTSDAHRALSDCYITYYCYSNIFGKKETPLPPTPANNINNIFEEKIYNILQDIISEQELPPNCLYLSSNYSRRGKNEGKETSKSICVYEPSYPDSNHYVDRKGKNDTFAQMTYPGNGEVIFRIRDYFLKEVDIPLTAKIRPDSRKNKSGIASSFVIFNLDDETILTFLKSIVLIGLKYYESTSSFGCCSRFIQCSDAKKCVHDNKLYSKGCMYRKNLEAGRIFYGINRNID